MDLKNPRLMLLKALLLLIAGGLASTTLLLLAPGLKIALLLAIAVWSFARAYYFAFYVIQHYIDPTYHFAGLWSAVRYLLGKR